MIAAVFSDSHKDLKTLGAAAEAAKAFGATKMIHLGDTFRDGLALKKYSGDVVMVPGLWCDEYHDSMVPNRLIIDIGGFRTLLSHCNKKTLEDMTLDGDPEEIIKNEDIDILLHGHTHFFEAVIREGRLDLNPGSCRAGDKRAASVTYGLIFTDGKKATGKIMDLDGKILAETTLIKL